MQPLPALAVQVEMQNGTPATTQGDLLIPLVADFNRVLYTGLEGQYSTDQNTSLLGLGFGYRTIAKEEKILGGYLFVSRNLTPAKHALWVLNPGFERLGEIWDFRANAYLPVGKTNWITREGYAADLDDYEYIIFRQHQELDRWEKKTEQAGIGGDFELGHHFRELRGLSIYAGPYYYHFDHTDNIAGGEARLQYDVNDFISLASSSASGICRNSKFYLYL